MTTYPHVDKHGHAYADARELTEAVEWLENDAAYLHATAAECPILFVQERVEENAKKSARYAEELKQALADTNE